MTAMTSSTSHETSRATGARLGTGAPLPRAGSGGGTAPLLGTDTRLLQTVLFFTGAVLLPLGLVVIVLGWYGASNTPYQYDQISYLVSGGLLGLGLTFAGGFLYFGAWLARIAEDGRASSQRLADTLLVLAEATAGGTAPTDTAALRVFAGEGTTLHRRDCSLIAHRDDLRPAGANADTAPTCRICLP